MADSWGDAYAKYRQQLQSGDVNADFIKSLYEPLKGTRSEEWDDFADRIINIHKELAAQQQLKTESGKTLGEMWYGGKIGKDDATWDMAFRLAETGVDSLYDVGQRMVETIQEGYNGPETVVNPEFYNKQTGEPLTNFNQKSGSFDTTYNLQFTPEGVPVAYTGNVRSEGVWLRDAIKGIANTIGMFTPAAPYIAAANAANFAKKGEWEKAILAALPTAGKFAGQVGAAADTVSTINEANKYAKILKSLDDGNLLSAAFQGADLAGVSDVLGYDINDVKKAVNLGMAVKGADENPMALFQAATAFAPQSGSGKADAGYQMTTDFGSGANYQLFPDSDYQGLGLKVPTDLPDVFNPDGSINYDLFDFNQFGEPIGLKMPKSPNIDSMGGGQGLRLPVDGGYITEAGFIPEGYTPDLGDPESFINKPAPGADVSDAVKKALDASAKAGEKKPSPQGSPDLSSLIAMSGGRQGPIPLVVPENAADIKLMDEIFGTSLSAPSTGNETDRDEALARLLRS